MININLRDYFAIHSTQPGCNEICKVAGVIWKNNKVWINEQKSISFNDWYESLPLEEQLLLCAKVRYKQADAMMKVKND